MAESLTNVLIIGTVIFAIAMVIPIFFEVDFPQKGTTLNFVEKALCTIFANGGGNVTCTVPDDIVHFNSTTPSLLIIANNTEKTVYFTINGTGDSTTASNLGNGSEVFANQVFDNLEFRTLVTDGSGTTLTQNPNDITFGLNNILIDSIDACANNELLQWQTGSEWVCVSPASVGNDTDTDERVQVKEGGSNVGIPRHINYADANDFIILEDVGNNEIDIAINRDGSFGIPSLDGSGLLSWAKLNFTTSNIHDLANVGSGPCANNEILKWNSTTSMFECKPDLIGSISNFDSLTDVTITAVSNNNLVQYDSGSGQWKNVSPNTALTSFFGCTNNQILKYNSTFGGFTCQSDQIGSAGNFDSLTDVTITAVANNNLVKYNSGTGQWENVTPNQVLLTFGCTDAQVLRYNSGTTTWICQTLNIDYLSDVTITAVANNNLVKYNSGTGQWENVTPSAVLSTFACTNTQILKYNSGTGLWECKPDLTVKFAVLTGGGATLQTPASTTPDRKTESGTNFDYVALEFDPTSTTEEVIWQYQLPTDADDTQSISVLIRFLTPSGSTGGVCFTGSFLGRTNLETYNVAMGTAITTCNSSLDTAGDINQVTLTFTSGQHGLAAGDSVIFKLIRATANGADTHTGDAHFIDARVTWS